MTGPTTAVVSLVLVVNSYFLLTAAASHYNQASHKDDDLDRITDALFQAVKRSASWAALHSTWGKRAAGWNNLQGSWGKRGEEASFDYEDEDDMGHVSDDDDDTAVEPSMKRSWNEIRPSWGKRDTDRDWNSFRGAWGKRRSSSSAAAVPFAVDSTGSRGLNPRGVWGKRPSWKQLSMWGKRSQKWNQLSSGWGKRTPQAPDNVDDDDDNEGLDTQKEKRGTWNKMTPMWGKRDAKIDLASLADELEKRAQAGWSHLNGAWGKRSAAPGTWKNLKGAWGKREAPDQQQQQQEQHLMNSSPAGSAEHGKGPERPLASEDKE